MDAAGAILSVGVLGFTAVAAVWDMRTKRLPNGITVPALAAGFVFHIAAGAIQPPHADQAWYSGAVDGLLFSLGGFAIGFLPLFAIWAIAGTGAGDVKLMGAIGAWLGWRMTAYAFVASALVAIVIKAGIAIYRALRPNPAKSPAAERDKTGAEAKRLKSASGAKARKHRQIPVPYGVPMAVGTWLVLIWKIVLANS